MEHQGTIAHDRLDRIVASVFGWCERAFAAVAPNPSQQDLNDIAFSDEWERQQIARELHWN